MKDVRILIVEEDAIAQLTLAQHLKDLGYEDVAVTDNGAAALKKIASEKVDLVFLNSSLTGSPNGIATGEIISKKFSHIPFVYLSASTDKPTVERALKTKPYGIVHKPYELQTLGKVISGAWNYRKSMQRSNALASNPMSDLILEKVGAGICVTDIHRKFIRVNQAYCDICGYTRQELIGKDFTLVLPTNIREYAANLHDEFLEGRTEESKGEWEVLDKQGHIKEVLTTEGRMITETGERYKITTVTDITEKKKDIESLKIELQEKDAFAKEVHHRVKNNLNIISGLLFLQSEKVREKPEVYDLFQESINRIKTISVIHEQLYSQENFSGIDLKKYITALNNNLQITYMTTAKHVATSLHVEDIIMDVDKAVACGLIINEALSNSLKHAFIPDQPGKINVKIHTQDQQVRIEMSDNGKGLPLNFDLAGTRTLGFQLMKTLAGQLKGKLQVRGTQATGTVVELVFDA